MITSAAHPRWSLRPPSWIWLPSITGQTSGLIDLIFLWLIGVTRGRFLSMISSTAHPRWPLHGRHLGFGFRRLNNKRLGRFIRFFCGLLGVITGKFLSMISSAKSHYCQGQNRRQKSAPMLVSSKSTRWRRCSALKTSLVLILRDWCGHFS
jgi:hypothetical protein